MANMAEVAKAIHNVICYLSERPDLSCMAVGGLYTRQDDLETIDKSKCKIVVGTGGRLQDLAKQSTVFKQATILVLDEGQLMLQKKRTKHLDSWHDQSRCIWGAMRASPFKQLVSATATSQKDSIDQVSFILHCLHSHIYRWPTLLSALEERSPPSPRPLLPSRSSSSVVPRYFFTSFWILMDAG